MPNCPLLRSGSATWPTPTTSPPCTPSWPPKLKPPGTTATATWSRPRSARPPPAALAPGPLAVPHPARRRTRRLDPAEVIRTAITSRDLAGSRDIAAVLDARIRPRIDPLLPQPQGPWAGRVPELPDPDRRAYLAQIAAMMDDRTRRLGQHTGAAAPTWAVTALGPVPANSAARRDWEHQAAAIAAYRQMYGYDHPEDPIGPEPSHQAPGQRAAWHEAFLAAGPADGSGVRALPYGRLWLLRDIYAAETTWALLPRRQGTTPGTARRLRRRARATRATAEADTARKADDQDRAARHEHLAASYRALRDQYQQQEQALAQAMADRQEWEQATARSRYLAIAADAELRRRHPTRKIEPLRSAEPVPVSDAGRQHQDLVPQGSGEIRPRFATSRSSGRPSAPGWANTGTWPPARMQPGAASAGYLPPCRRGATRSCSRLSRRSPHRRRSSSSPPSTTSSPRPEANHYLSRHSRRRASITRGVSLGICAVQACHMA